MDFNIDHFGLNNSLKVLWKYHILFGILFLILGLGAILNPNFFSISIIFVIGWFILFSGFGNLYYSIAEKNNPTFHWGTVLFQAIVEISSGVLILLNPFFSIYFLIVYIGIFLIFRGFLILFSRNIYIENTSYFNGIKSLLKVHGLLDVLFGILAVLAPFFIETLAIYIIAFYCFLGGLLLIIYGYQIKETIKYYDKN
ncbi:HdeD family acid-resistance protein [Cetobacterium sp. SF1]|uniref:HdeD family acid-resistance protein n=1 Tax=unclassified Cetobacterium TaxID=2630983 RepID=UPI003CEE4E54